METIADLIGRRFDLETKAGLDMPAEGTLATIINHRSHRRYLEDPVPDSLLAVLLACAQSAPTKSDLQQYSIIVVHGSEARRREGAGTASSRLLDLTCVRADTRSRSVGNPLGELSC